MFKSVEEVSRTAIVCANMCKNIFLHTLPYTISVLDSPPATTKFSYTIYSNNLEYNAKLDEAEVSTSIQIKETAHHYDAQNHCNLMPSHFERLVKNICYLYVLVLLPSYENLQRFVV